MPDPYPEKEGGARLYSDSVIHRRIAREMDYAVGTVRNVLRGMRPK